MPPKTSNHSSSSHSHSPPRWLVLDVHGVLIPSSERWILRHAARKTRQGIIPIYFRWFLNLKAAQTGRTPAKRFYETVFQKKLSEKEFHSLIMDMYAERGHIPPSIINQLKVLKKSGWKLAVLSDMNTAQAAFHHARHSFALFDQVLLSCETGLMKPFPSAYLSLEKRLRTRKDHIVFADDMWLNTLAAQLMGWRSVTVKHGKQLAHFLKDLE